MLLSVTGPDTSDALRSLADWLRRDPELRGVQIVPVSQAPDPEEMGGVADALEIIQANGEVVTAIATTIGLWLGTRIRGTKLKVRNGDREVVLEAGRIKDPVGLVERLTRELTRADAATEAGGARLPLTPPEPDRS